MIKAFEVTRYNHNLLNGQVEMEYIFGIKDDVRSKSEVFTNLQSANAYLEASMRDWFLGALDDYINHKKHIIEGGKHFNQDKPLETCTNAAIRFQKLLLKTICEQFLKGFVWFEAILPAQQNNSYLSSVDALNELKKFCETYLTRKV